MRLQIVTFYIVLLCMCLFSCKVPSYFYDLRKARQYFNDFIIKYRKVYASIVEQRLRLKIFRQNLNKINTINSMSPEALTHGVNFFSDLTKEEFIQQYTGFEPSTVPADSVLNVTGPISTILPKSFDWRERNAVSSVKYQGACSSCWAFVCTGVVEGAYGKIHGRTSNFSVQQMVDCAQNGGCTGKALQISMKYLVDAGGQMAWEDYPYTSGSTGKLSTCQFNKDRLQVNVTNVISYNLSDEDKLKELIVQNGPIGVVIDGDYLQSYKGNIFNCTFKQFTHAVLLIGYGEEDGVPYWIIKNSWGTSWGEGGYARIRAGDNPCGMMNKWAVGAAIV